MANLAFKGKFELPRDDGFEVIHRTEAVESGERSDEIPQVAQEEEKEPTDLGGQGKGDGDDGSDFDLGLSDGGSMDEGDGQTESDSEVEVAETGEEEDQTQRPSESSPASSPLSAAVLQVCCGCLSSLAPTVIC